MTNGGSADCAVCGGFGYFLVEEDDDARIPCRACGPDRNADAAAARSPSRTSGRQVSGLDERAAIVAESFFTRWSRVIKGERLCEDCPPVGYPTDKTRCLECPRGDHLANPTAGVTKE